MTTPRFVVITPAQNEEKFLDQTIPSVVSQTVRPDEWIIVDDGSTDRTALIAQRYQALYPWIKVVIRNNQGKRSIGPGVVEAFYYGFDQLSRNDYEFIFKIDADIILGPRYFQTIFQKFAENPRLGIATGDVYDLVGSREIKMRALPIGVAGAIKCWRRRCFEDIGGIVQGLAWDGIDCFEAMRLGWETMTYEDPDLRVKHLRPEGSSVQNRYRGWARRGKAMHFVGAHPVWVLASALYHMADRPFILGGMCMIISYLDAFLSPTERYDNPAFRRFLRRWQLKRLAAALRLA